MQGEVAQGALTAWQALHEHANLRPGQHVLVHGGGGGVGAYAVQLAAVHGARVTATASASDARYVAGLGAEQVIDYAGRFEDQLRNQATTDQDWRDTAERWLKDTGRIAAGNRTVWRSLGGALGLLTGCDVIRPDLGWLLTSATPAHLAADMARFRDPDGFAALQKVAGPASVSVTSTRRAMLQIAVMMSVKGGLVGDITVGDCLELLEARARSRGDGDNGGTYFYQLLGCELLVGVLGGGAVNLHGGLPSRENGGGWRST
jgi:threonine dehydrogenase-like Zn-dependent dehydrogenase